MEILTSEKQHPKEEWLNSVITGKAIARIRNYLREHKRIAAEEGKEILKKRFSKEKITFNDDNVQKLVKFFKIQSALDLYYNIQKGLISQDKLEIESILNFKPNVNKLTKTSKTKEKPNATSSKNEIIVPQL